MVVGVLDVELDDVVDEDVDELDVLELDDVVAGCVVVLVDDDVVLGRVEDVVVVVLVVLSCVTLPIATPIPAPAINNTNAMPHTPAGLMRTPCP